MARDRPVRRVNGVYETHFQPKSTEEIQLAVNKIKSALQNKTDPNMIAKINQLTSSFNSSECFAAWLRYQNSEFLKAFNANDGSSCKLNLSYHDGFKETKQFKNLSDCVDKVRLLQKEGAQSIISFRNQQKDLMFF